MLGSIAEKLGKDFAPFLPHAVEAAFASCSQAMPQFLHSSFTTACKDKSFRLFSDTVPQLAEAHPFQPHSDHIVLVS